MFDSDDQRSAGDTPTGEQNRVPVAGAEGWFYLPFEHLEDSGDHRITLVRDDDDDQVAMTLPYCVDEGAELGEIALLVIRAYERWRQEKGLGA